MHVLLVGEAIRGSFFAIGNATSILLDDTDCDGSEASLLSCQHRAIGGHNCDNTEHAGVRCSSVFLSNASTHMQHECQCYSSSYRFEV